MKENSAQKSTQAANLVTVDLPPNPATNPLNTLRPPHWPPVPSPAVCLFIFYVRVGVQVCPRERRSSALNGPLLLGPVGSVGASHHIAVYVACVFACLDSLLRTVVARLVMCYHGDVCLGVLRGCQVQVEQAPLSPICDPVL